MAKVKIDIKLDTWYYYEDDSNNFYFKLNSQVRDDFGRNEIKYVNLYTKSISKNFISLLVLKHLNNKYYKLVDNQATLTSLYG
jgi:hypothetical protein